ncbi:MAG: LapA family protein [Candidatus Delongbacteria bacterium]|jgi:type III secretory pathway component EscU|nr:LapA family protein [Candidatus Delongbacteria bacterium]
MNYAKRIFQLVLLFAIIWLTIQNYDAKTTLKVFNKDLPEASVILVIFFSLLLGGIISAFFSALKDFKNSKEHNKVLKELKLTSKDLEIKTKDLLIAVNDLDKMKVENNSLSNEITTLKEVMKYPNKAINTDEGKKLIDY